MKSNIFFPIILTTVTEFACTPKSNSPTKLEISTTSIEYKQDGKDFEGYISFPKSNAKLPAVLVIHEWGGLNEYTKSRADQLAQLGYFAFAMDMYGKGIRAKDHKEASELSGVYGKDRKLMRGRIAQAIKTLRARPEIDTSKIAIIGYCFGGLAAIEHALTGEALNGIMVFHAGLILPTIATDAGKIKSPIVIHHGGDDNFIQKKDIDLLKTSFDKNKVNYEFIVHPGAKHGFTNKFNIGHEGHGLEYNEIADKASWKSLEEKLKIWFK